MTNVPTLGQRALNRALLARQLLLERADRDAVGTIEHLIRMQAQAPLAPYVGLWTRLARFDPKDLGDPLTERKLVRGAFGRAELREAFSARWPDWDADTMVYAASYLVPNLQPTPRGVWGRNGKAALTTIESWLGQRTFQNEDGATLYGR
jgi:hypothetical protein